MPLLTAFAVFVPLLALGVGFGFFLGRSGRRQMLERQEQLEQQLANAERQSNEASKRTISKMRRELDTVSNLALALPHVVRDLNRDDLDPNDVPKLIIQLANAIFEPRHILLYSWQPTRPGSRERVLGLTAQRGFDDLPETLKSVQPGEGKIGWVAQHELDMLKEDWDTLRVNEGVDVADNHPSFKADVIGPLIHHAKQRQHVLGVLCIGAPRIRPRDEKLMFQMVTNFGSLGLVSTWNMKKLRSAAHHDGLTSLLNKRAFLDDMASKTLVECEKAAKPFSIFIFDIDHFKSFNDSNGHPAGDQLLRSMGALIRRHLRPGDLACRYGGEEFVIAMPNTERRVAAELAEQFRQTIAAEPFEHRENQPMGFVSISGGVAAFPADGASVAELIQRADEALYRSKKGGRNRVTQHRNVEIGDLSDLPAGAEGVAQAAARDLPPVERR
jgi:diguanylate cyclase (GGDEF)-like protein